VTTHTVSLPIELTLPQSARVSPAGPEMGATRAEAPVGRASGLAGRCLLHLPRFAWITLDVLIATAGVVLGHRLFVWWGSTLDVLSPYGLGVAGLVLAVSIILAGNMFGLYDAETLWSRSRVIARVLLTVTAAMTAMWLVMHLFMYSQLSRRSIATGFLFFLVVASVVRLLAHHAVRDVRRGLIVIGQGVLTGTIVRSVRRGAVPGYRLVGVVDTNAALREGSNGDIPVIGRIDDVERLCRENDVSEIVVANPDTHQPAHIRAALACLRLGCRVTDETTFYESTFGEVPVTHITPTWFLAADLKAQRREYAFGKRIFDVVAAAIGLVLSAPLMLLTAIALKLREGGPVLYSQRRVGRGGTTFTLYKFRTMRCDAEADGMAWCRPNDPRITRIGRFLRRSRIDELPQLWNILKGEMSIVGPRPERPEFVGPLSAVIPFYDERHLIKPGLTGWAQINFSYGASIADTRRKLQLDLYYVKHTSFELDLIIMLRTFGTFFLGSR